MPRKSNIAPNRHLVHPFDLKHGTDTGGYVRPEDLSSGRVHDAMNNGYSAVGPSVFRQACQRWRETLPFAARVEAYSFVDVGAGKGRALLLAAELPFRKVIGVELNEDLARIAKKNVALWERASRGGPKIRVLQQDALEFPWPRTPLVVYLNNPFDCSLVERLAERLATAAKDGAGLLDVIYANPGCPDALVRQGSFKLLWDGPIEMEESDQQADPYGAAADRVAGFRYVATPRERGAVLQ